MATNQNDPLRPVSYLFEIAVRPFQASSRCTAKEDPYCDQQLLLILLYPAMVLLPLLCLLISIVANAYVFLALPVIGLLRCVVGIFYSRPNRLTRP